MTKEGSISNALTTTVIFYGIQAIASREKRVRKLCNYCNTQALANSCISYIGAFQNVSSLKLCQNCQREESPCASFILHIVTFCETTTNKVCIDLEQGHNIACNIRTVMITLNTYAKTSKMIIPRVIC